MSLVFPNGSRTLPFGRPKVGGGLSKLPWENTVTDSTPTIRTGSSGGTPASGNSLVSNLLHAPEPVPMGQAATDGGGWFPHGDPRNNPDVIDPRPGDRPPALMMSGNETLGDDMPRPPSANNPFQGMSQTQMQGLLEQLQKLMGGGGTATPGHPNPNAPYQTPPWRPTGGGVGPTRPGELSNADLIAAGLPGQRRPQTGLEPGHETPDYVDDIRPPYQRPQPSYATRSDRRLKSNIVRIGTHPQHGIGIYDYDIDGRRDTGVMAQELLSVLPAAVSLGHDGFLRVDYSAL